jgi:hypothetical protein
MWGNHLRRRREQIGSSRQKARSLLVSLRFGILLGSELWGKRGGTGAIAPATAAFLLSFRASLSWKASRCILLPSSSFWTIIR